jgi:hypothetical protein
MRRLLRELVDRIFRHTRSTKTGSKVAGIPRPRQMAVQHAHEAADRLPPRDESFFWVWQHWHH